MFSLMKLYGILAKYERFSMADLSVLRFKYGRT